MSTYQTAQDQFITVDGIKFAYRRLGTSHGIPLVLLMHFRGTMDHWDPALVNPLAAKRPVILIDNAGVGRSQGQVPKSFPQWAQYYTNVVAALGITRVDVMGFSMGGCVAQLVALNAPQLVRKLVLCGTTPSMGEGVVKAPLGPFNRLKAAVTEEQQKEAFLEGMFNNNREAGEASWKRISEARGGRVEHVDPENSHRQAIAFAKFMNRDNAAESSYDRFDKLRLPVLIANGNEDLLLPTENSYLMYKKLSKAGGQLHLYPASGHGFLFQYADEFSKLVNDFLDSEVKTLSHL